jgi:hypothetical protein
MKDNMVKVYRAVLTVRLSARDKAIAEYDYPSEEDIRLAKENTDDDPPESVRNVLMYLEDPEYYKDSVIKSLIDDIVEEVPDAIRNADLEKAYKENSYDTELALPDYIDAEILSTTIHYEGIISRDMMRDFDGIYDTFKVADYLYSKGDDSFTMTFTLIQYEDGTVEDFYTPGCYNALVKC